MKLVAPTDDPIILPVAEADSYQVVRSFDAGDINPIVNDPSVFPLVSVPGIESFDLAPVIADTRNVLLMAEGGGILFIYQNIGTYEVHTNFLAKHRGRNAVRASLAAYNWMFTHTDCMALQTKVPAFNKSADMFCRVVGARLEFERKEAWPTAGGMVGLKFYAMHYYDWLWKTPSLAQSGQRFHARLTDERLRLGSSNTDHGDEPCHDIAVGACAEMLYGGQPDKAVILYNEWAQFAGYGGVVLISRNPLIVDVGTELLQVGTDDFKVLLCRSVEGEEKCQSAL